MKKKEEIIKRIAQQYKIDENVVSKIVSHQFISANTATDVHNSVEFSGFGKFIFSEKKGCNRFEKYISQLSLFTELLDKQTSEKMKDKLIGRINTAKININHLKPKLYVIERNSRGLEE